MARDPQSPAFHVNLRYGLRFVQVSVLISPPSPGPARALPVRFELAPPAVKPNKNTSAEMDKAYPPKTQKPGHTFLGREASDNVRPRPHEPRGTPWRAAI